MMIATYIYFIISIMQGQLENKVAFILFFQGDQLRNKVLKICEGYVVASHFYMYLYSHVLACYILVFSTCYRFHATLYQCPETASERDEMTVAVANRINDLQSVLRTTDDHSLTQLQEIGQEIDTWHTKVYMLRWLAHLVLHCTEEARLFLNQNSCL